MQARISGPFLIALAALLWATDSIFRLPAAQALDATIIVFIEHALVVLILFIPLLFVYGRKLFDFELREWLTLVLLGAGASAIATLWFTASFRYVNPSVAILLQKLQPAMVILLAYGFLGERPARRYYGWAALALFAAIWLSFPDLSFPSFLQLDLRSVGVLYSLGAATLWAIATVGGRFLAKRADAVVITFWRFVFGLIALSILVLIQGNTIPWQTLESPEMLRNLLYMSLVPGLLAMLLYYFGLKRTPASVATFVELLFPVGAVILNTLILKLPLQPIQLVSGSLLLFAVYRLSRN